jgi:hypothetical protein
MIVYGVKVTEVKYFYQLKIRVKNENKVVVN